VSRALSSKPEHCMMPHRRARNSCSRACTRSSGDRGHVRWLVIAPHPYLINIGIDICRQPDPSGEATCLLNIESCAEQRRLGRRRHVSRSCLPADIGGEAVAPRRCPDASAALFLEDLRSTTYSRRVRLPRELCARPGLIARTSKDVGWACASWTISAFTIARGLHHPRGAYCRTYSESA
jgi:hypothetical protein